MPHVVFNLQTALTRWNFGPFPIAVLLVCIAVGEWYQHSVWKLKLKGRTWPSGRRASFMLGLLTLWLAFQSPLAVLSGSYFQAHILQHLVLMVVSPPLLALGAPSTLLLQTSSRRTKSRWLHILSSRPFRVVTHPVVGWFFYYGFMFVFFMTPLINVAMMHMDLMDLINVVFLFGGTLFWWPMVGLDPIMHWRMSHAMRMLNILIGTGLEAFLGVAILADSRPIASMYTLGSTHSGGALLWVSTELATMGAFLPIYIQWRRADAREAARSDARMDRAFAKRRATLLPGATMVEISGISEVTDVENVEDVEAASLSLWEVEWLRRTGAVPGRRMAVRSNEDAQRQLNASSN